MQEAQDNVLRMEDEDGVEILCPICSAVVYPKGTE